MMTPGMPPAELRLMSLNATARYALLGLRVLALGKKERPRLVSEVAREAGIPANMTAKVFQKLARAGVLRSRRGPGGGYSLAAKPADIPLSTVLQAVQEIGEPGHQCLLRNRTCAPGDYCTVHDVVTEADKLLVEGFGALTLEQLADGDGWS